MRNYDKKWNKVRVKLIGLSIDALILLICIGIIPWGPVIPSIYWTINMVMNLGNTCKFVILLESFRAHPDREILGFSLIDAYYASKSGTSIIYTVLDVVNNCLLIAQGYVALCLMEGIWWKITGWVFAATMALALIHNVLVRICSKIAGFVGMKEGVILASDLENEYLAKKYDISRSGMSEKEQKKMRRELIREYYKMV